MAITNGRANCLIETLMSADRRLKGPITNRVIVNDSANPRFDHWLEGYVSPLFHIVHTGGAKGFAGAIQCGWDYITRQTMMGEVDCDYIFHLEDDFTFNEDIDLVEMTNILRADPKLAQLALMRQAWNEEEKAAGGIVPLRPDDFENAHLYTKHGLFFTTNPCLYRLDLIKRGWPQESESEGKFGIKLREDGYHFGFYQDHKFDPPKVTHIGEHRTGTGY